MSLEVVREIVRIKQITQERNEDFLKKPINFPEDAVDAFIQEIGDEDREVFMVMCLDAKCYINAIHRCHVGTINSTLVSPREVFKSAILSNSNSIIVGHCHISGNTQPSKQDIQVTRRLIEVGKMLDIPVIESFIVSKQGGDVGFTALMESGFI